MLSGFGRLFADCLGEAAPELSIVEADGDLLRCVVEQRPDVVAISIDGQTRDVMRAIGGAEQDVRVIVYGVEPSQELRWIEAGAHGCLPRDASLAETKQTVRLAADGQMAASPELASALFSRLAELTRARRRTNVLESLVLTSRELAVLRLIAEGLSNRDVAQRLSLSFHTVKNHVQNIFKKTGVTRRKDAVDHARQRGWLEDAEVAEPSDRECPPGLAASRIRELARELAGDEPVPAITPREMEVLRLVARGLTNKEIARHLRIWLQTVKSHLHSIYTRLGVRTRRAAIAKALRLELIRED